jgi:hypothetical protein
LRDTITSFVAIDAGKVKGAVNECILMCQIKPFLKRKEFMASGIVLYQGVR